MQADCVVRIPNAGRPAVTAKCDLDARLVAGLLCSAEGIAR